MGHSSYHVVNARQVYADLFEDVRSVYRRLIRSPTGEYYPRRSLFDEIMRTLASDITLTVIYGLRGVGKTFLLYQVMDALDREGIPVYYVPVADLYRRLRDPRATFYAVFDYMGLPPHELEERTIVLFDEVHVVPDWDGWLKEVYERALASPLSMVATGSSSLGLLRGKEILRRAALREMPPLSFPEYLHISSLGRWKRPTLPPPWERLERYLLTELDDAFGDALAVYRRFLLSGGFPLFMRAGQEYYELLRGVVSKIVQEDLPAVGNLSGESLAIADDVLTFLAETVGAPVSLDRISSRIGVPRSTVHKLIRHLELTGVIFSLSVYGSPARRLRSPKKYYFASPDLIPAILGYRGERAALERLPALLENGIASTLYYSPYVRRLYYAPAAADFVAELQSGERLAVEVGVGKRSPTQLGRVSADVKMVVHMGREIRKEDGVLFVPAPLFALQIGGKHVQ